MSAETAAMLGGRYRVREPLGAGGMSDVLRAHDAKLGRDVAVKVLRDRRAATVDGRRRFAAEAATLAKLSHPSLITLLDADLDHDPPYIVFELVEGRSLAAAVAFGPLDAATVKGIGADVAEGLAYAHSAGVIHRDLKPANILIRHDGHAQLADFGIARLLDQTTHHTVGGLLVGSPAYLSPEQASGKELTPASDIYALGLVLLEALTAETQSRGTLAEVVALRVQGPVVLPSDMVVAWKQLLRGMTDRDPENRPSAEDVTSAVSDLPDRAFKAEPVSTDTAILTDLRLDEPGIDLEPTEAFVPVGARAWWSSALDSARLRVRRLAGASSVAVLTVLALLVAFLVVIVVATALSDDASQRPTVPAPSDVPSQYQAPLDELDRAIHGDTS